MGCGPAAGYILSGGVIPSSPSPRFSTSPVAVKSASRAAARAGRGIADRLRARDARKKKYAGELMRPAMLLVKAAFRSLSPTPAIRW